DHLLPVRHGHTRSGGRQVGLRPGGRDRAGAASVRLLLRDRAMNAPVEARDPGVCADAPTGVEGIFAEVLAGVLRLARVSVKGHFFDDLGAHSLVMAHFCARVRKRGDLPSVSMKDIYRYPTIRSLAAALADVAPSSPRPAVPAAIEPPTPTSTREYILCGVLQGLFFLAYSYLAVLAIDTGYAWVSAGSSAVEMYLRLVLAGSGAFLVVCAVPIAAKWVLIGRWKAQQISLWSLA